GQTTEGMGVDEAVSLIRGPQGTAVTLLVYREGQSSSKEISITREAINIKSVEWEIRSDNIAYLKIRQFNEMTMPLFNDAVLDILSRPDIRGIILDLRYNPGGYLQTAIDVSGEWINGKLVVSEKLRDGSEILHNSTKKARLDAYQTVVLVNAGSASASEIVAGALQDWGEGVIVGEKTFGKGSIQDLNNLSDGSSVKLTVAKWFTPQGRSIDDEGIEPDVAVEMIEADYDQFRDPQLDKAVEIIFSNN
ncbi:MAG TPA: S41 family peptidase, partial [bacterium]|nr:S41 family peptidase [bacterium]HOH67474.1 S41 family peptidase [bacterium]